MFLLILLPRYCHCWCFYITTDLFFFSLIKSSLGVVIYTSLLFGVGVISAISSIIIFWSFTLQLTFLLVNSVISSSLKSSYRCLELALDFVDFAVVGVFTIMIGVFCRFWVLM